MKWIFLTLSVLLLTATKVSAIEPTLLIAEVNAARQENGLPALVGNTKLASSTSLKLGDIQQYHYWAHQNPETKVAWWQPIWNSGYRGKVGENLARGFSTEKGVVEGWLKSPAHRANLLNSNYRTYGVSVGNVNYDSGAQEVTVFHFGI